jgi:DNA recombination protein RmuC
MNGLNVVLGLLGSAAFGALLVAIWLGAQLRRLTAQAQVLGAEIQAGEIERTRIEAQAARASDLEKDLSDGRARLELLSGERAALQSTAERVPALERQVASLSGELMNLNSINAALTTQVREQAQAHQEKVAALTDVKSGIESGLKAMAAEVLQSNQGAFLELANQAFEKHQVGADADLEARQKAVADLILPLQDTLVSYRQQVEQLERSRAEAYGSLSGQLRSVAETQNAVRSETSKLVQALRASPKTRGRWGEHSLRNVLEISGLNPYCDFSTEETFERDDGRLRPDAIIHLPGNRHLVVDAKTSMSAYLDSLEAADESERERLLVLHAAQLRAHVKQLSGKAYWDGLTVTPDFVVMFVPGDNFWAAATERDPSLFGDAVGQRVVIATPSTLIALAKSVAFGWRQEKVAENAQRLHELGRELYRRMIVMTEHIHNCGNALGKSVKCFNEFIGSLEHSVMPQARRFNELEVEGTATEIPVLEHIETEPRLLRADRDFAEHLALSANSNTDTQSRPAA